MIDRRRNYVLVLDTETANTLVDEKGNMDMSCVLVYDCGWAVVDTKGNLYETASFVNRDIFKHERELMQTAYYAEKIPRYEEDLRKGVRTLASTFEIRQAMLQVIEKYSIKQVAAYNARFDDNALRSTQKWVTKSQYRYWFPFDSVVVWDIMKMAQDVILKMPTYLKFCEEHEYFTPTGRPKKTAEIVYRFITGNNDFEESHTGLEDVLIESEIMWYCFRQHKAMRKELYENREPFPQATEFQIELLANLKKEPMVRGF